MYGYPEQFIPGPEYGFGSTGPVADRALPGAPTSAPASTVAMTGNPEGATA